MQAPSLVRPAFDLEQANHDLSSASAEDVVEWAVARFGRNLIMSTSFGAHSAVMLDLVTRIVPRIPVVFIDTGYLFPETYRFAEELKRRFHLNLKVYVPEMSAAHQEAIYGKLWEQGEDGIERYLQINKVEPMQRALDELGAAAWLAGLRADQTDHRASLRPVDVQNGRVKIHPILRWSAQEIDAYIEERDLPYHPLYAEGYRSIGDHHSTLPTTPDMDPRDGRILGQKKECGLHLPLSEGEDQSLRSSGL